MIVNRNEDADNCPKYNVHIWNSAVEIRDMIWNFKGNANNQQIHAVHGQYQKDN